MALSVPPSKNYQSPLIAVPTKWDQTPVEGSKLIPCEVDWGVMGGPSNCIAFNLQNNATLNFSQIVALSIDNSACGSDIEFIFPDTTETLSIPAYTPKTIVPVFTNQTQFWLSSPNAQSEDVTRFSILNSMPPPIAVPTTQEQNVSVYNNVLIFTTGSQQLVASSIDGTLENAFLSYAGNSGSAGEATWEIIDGNNNVIAGGTILQGAGLVMSPIFNVNDVRIRFQNGLSLTWTTTGSLSSSSAIGVNLYYRTP